MCTLGLLVLIFMKMRKIVIEFEFIRKYKYNDSSKLWIVGTSHTY